ncbi:hypothetical protein ASE35_11755 [Lysobacter sp. Root916]|uniref:hypothetical protein n=1 Tax=Lysobacter sp. Root916 TaxID=1736606 RepID=UPI0007096665|nr:hypothetical protein [Lysobacter sp. Root916]KRD34375.1 hypothetical protein ASE35_11755 [Lysobacter sp. Root916]
MNAVALPPALQDFERRVAAVDWDAYERPQWSDAAQVRAALADALHAHDRTSSERAYHAVLYAVGNNHAGTYHAIALAVLPFLGELMRHGQGWARSTALEAFFDLALSFEPDRDQQALAPELARQARAMRPVLEAIAAQGGADAVTAHEALLALEPGAD